MPARSSHAVCCASAERKLNTHGLFQKMEMGKELVEGLIDKVHEKHGIEKHHGSYSHQTVIAAQPTIVYAPMPVYAVDPAFVAPASQPGPEKTKTLTIDLPDHHGKTKATFTISKTEPANPVDVLVRAARCTPAMH